MATQAELAITKEMDRKPPSTMALLQVALEHQAAIDVIERLAALQEKVLAREAEALFNEAMNRVQSELQPVAKNLDNKHTNSKYASYAALDRAVRPIYSKEGFSLSFDTGDAPGPDMVRVVCYCSHSAGHTRTYKVDMPADGKGAKGGDVMTKTHATGAAMSYGMRYLLKYIFNIAIGEDDTDGNVTFDALNERLEWIASANAAELQSIFIKAYKDASAASDEHAKKLIVNAKDRRKKELGL